MSAYFNTIKQLGFGDYTTHHQAKGRISRLSSISRQLFKAHYDGYHPRMSRQLATALKRTLRHLQAVGRYINTRPKHERRTAEFVGEIRRKISCLHEYNLQIAKVRYKYPRSELFDTVLMQYVELECELLYHTYREVDPEHEKHVTERVLRFLRVIQHDSLQSSEVSLKSTIQACDKVLLKLFANVRADCISENKLVANTIIKLLNRLNLLDEVNKLKGKNIPFQQDTFLRDPLVSTIRQTLTTSDYESDLDQDDDYLVPVIDEFSSENPSKNFNLDDELFCPSRHRFTQDDNFFGSDNNRSLPRFNYPELSYRAFESSLSNHGEAERRRNGNSIMDLNFVPYHQGDAIKMEPTRFEDTQTNENVNGGIVTIEIPDDDDDDSNQVNSFNLLQANEIKLEENEENRSPNFPIPHSEGNEQNFLSSDKSSKNSTSNGYDNTEKKSSKDCAKETDGPAILISDSEDEAVDSVIGSDRSKHDFEELEDYCEAVTPTCDFDKACVSQEKSKNNETVASVFDSTTVGEDVNETLTNETTVVTGCQDQVIRGDVETVIASKEFDETLVDETVVVSSQDQVTLSEVETSSVTEELDETLTNERAAVSDCQEIDNETSHEVEPTTICEELGETPNSGTTQIFCETIETTSCPKNCNDTSADELTESRICQGFPTGQINEPETGEKLDTEYEAPCEETIVCQEFHHGKMKEIETVGNESEAVISEANNKTIETFGETTPNDDCAEIYVEASNDGRTTTSMAYEENNEKFDETREVPEPVAKVHDFETASQDFDETHVGETLEVSVCEVEIQSENICDENRETELIKKGEVEVTCENLPVEGVAGAEKVEHVDAVEIRNIEEISDGAVEQLVTEDAHDETSRTIALECQTDNRINLFDNLEKPNESDQVLEQGFSTISSDVHQHPTQIVESEPIDGSEYQTNEQVKVDNVLETVRTSVVESDDQPNKEIYVENVVEVEVSLTAPSDKQIDNQIYVDVDRHQELEQVETDSNSTLNNCALEEQLNKQVNVDLRTETTLASVNDASENQPEKPVDVVLESEATSVPIIDTPENQVDVVLGPEPSISVCDAPENQTDKHVDVELEPKPTSAIVNDALETQSDKQVDVDLEPEPTLTSGNTVPETQSDTQVDVDLELEPTSTSVNEASENQPDKQVVVDLESESTSTSIKGSEKRTDKKVDVDLEPEPNSTIVNEASANQTDKKVDVDLEPEPNSTIVNEASAKQPDKQVDVDLESLNDTPNGQTEKQVDDSCNKDEVEASVGGSKCQTDEQSIEENSGELEGRKTSTDFIIPRRPPITTESEISGKDSTDIENANVVAPSNKETEQPTEISNENENNCQAIDYSVTACYPVQPPSVPKDATHFHQVNPVGPVYPDPIKSENSSGPEPLSIYTLSSTVTEAEYYDYNTQKKVGGDLELLANICADQETLAVKTDSEKEMASDLESQTKLNLNQLTPRRRKSKVKFDGKKKPSANEEDNKRLTRKSIKINRTDDPKYKPHDFFSIDTLPPRTNNVYAQKRLMDANTTSEDSNDSCGSTLYIDLEESQKHQEKTPKDEDSGPGEDKSEVCISIPEDEEVCVDDNFHILQQMEDFVDNNNREVPSKIPKARKKRPAKSPQKSKESKAAVPKKRGDKSPSKSKGKKDDTVKTPKTKGKRRQNKTDEDDDNMDDIPIEKRIAFKKSKLQDKRKTKSKEDEHLKNGSRSPRGRPKEKKEKEKKVTPHFEESCTLDISLNNDKHELSVSCTSNVTAVQTIPKKRKYDFPVESFAIKAAQIEEISPDLQSEEVKNDSLEIKVPNVETLTLETEPTKLEDFAKVIVSSVTVGETEVVAQKNFVREEPKVIKPTDHSIENILSKTSLNGEVKLQNTTVETFEDSEKIIKTKAAVKAYEDKSSVVGIRTRLRSKSSDHIQRQSTPCDRSRSSSVDCNSLSFSDSSHNESVSSLDVSVEDKNEDKDTSTNDSGVVVLKGMSEEEVYKSPVLENTVEEKQEKPPLKDLKKSTENVSKSSKTKGRTLENTIKKMKEKIEESEKAKNKILEEKKPEHRDKERHHKSSRSRSSSKSRSSGKHHSSDSEKDRRRRSHSKSVDSKVSTPDSHKSKHSSSERSSSKHETNKKSKPDKKKHEENKSKTEHKSSRSKSKRPDNDKKSEDVTKVTEKQKHLDQSDSTKVVEKAKHEHRKDKSIEKNTSRTEKRERSSKEKHKDRKENPKYKEKSKEEKKVESPKQKQQENGKTKHESDAKNASKIPKKRKYDLQDHGGAPQSKMMKTEPEKVEKADSKNIVENKNLNDVSETKIGKLDVKNVEVTKVSRKIDIDGEKTKERKVISNIPQLIKSANESEENTKSVKSDTKTIDKSKEKKVVKVNEVIESKPGNEGVKTEENKTVGVVSQAKNTKSDAKKIDSAKENKIPKVDKLKEMFDPKSGKETEESKTQVKNIKSDIKTEEKMKESRSNEGFGREKIVSGGPQDKNVKLDIKTGEKSKETKCTEEVEKKKTAGVAVPQTKNVKLEVKTDETIKETRKCEQVEKEKIVVDGSENKNLKLDIKTREKSKESKRSEEIERKKTAGIGVSQAKNVKLDVKADEIKETRNCEQVEKEKIVDGSQEKNLKLDIKTREKSKESKNEEIDRKKIGAIGVLQAKNVKSYSKSAERVKEIKTVDTKTDVSQSKIPKLRNENIERDITEENEAKSVKSDTKTIEKKIVTEIPQALVNHHEDDVKSGSDGDKKTENKTVSSVHQTKSVKPEVKRAEKRKERINSDSKIKESKTYGEAPEPKVAKLGSEVEKIVPVLNAVVSDEKTKENQVVDEISEHVKSPELDVKINEKTIECKTISGDVFQTTTADCVMTTSIEDKIVTTVPQVNAPIQKTDVLVQKDLPTDLTYETFASGLKINSKETEKRDLLLRNAIDPISSASSVYVNTVYSSSRNIDMVLTTPIDSTVKHLLGQEADLTLIPNVSSSAAAPCTSTTSVTTAVNASREKTCLFTFNEDAEVVNRDTEIFHTPLGLDEISPTKLPLASNQSLDFISPSTSIAEISNSMSLVQTLGSSTINFEVADTSETADHNYTLGDPLLGGNNEDKNILATGLSLSNSPEEFQINESHLEDLSFSENNFIEENGTLGELDLFLPCKKEKPDFDNIIDDPIPKPEDIESRIKHLNMMTIPQNDQPKTVSVDSTIDNSTTTDPSVGLGIDYAVNKLLFLGGSEVTLQNITDIENINIMETNNDQDKPEDPTPEITKPDSLVDNLVPNKYSTFLGENQKVVVEAVEQFPITSVDHMKEDFIEENRKTEKKPKPNPEPKPSKFAIFLESVKGGANKSENPKVEDEMEKYTVRRHNRTPVFPPKKKTVTQQLQNKTPPETKKTPPKGEILTFEAAINSKPQTAEGRIRVKTDLIKTNEVKSDVSSVEYISEHDQNIASEVVLPFSKPSPSTQDKKPPAPSTEDKKPPPPSTQDKKPPPTKHARFDKMGNDYIMENILNASEKDRKRKASENDSRREEKRSKKTESDKNSEKPSTDEIFDKLLQEGPKNKLFAQRMNEQEKKEPPKNRGYNTVQESYKKPPQSSSGYSHNNKHQKRPEYFTTAYMEKRNAERRHAPGPVNHSSSKRYRHDGNSYSSRSDPNINRDLKPRDRRLSSEQPRGLFPNSSRSESGQDDAYAWITSVSGLFDGPSDLFISPGSNNREDTSSRK